MERGSVLRRLLREARPYYKRLALAMLLGFIAGLAPLALLQLPTVFKRVLIYAHTANGVSRPTQIDAGALWLVIGIVLVSQIGGALAGYGQSYLTAWSGQRLIATLRARLFDRVNRMPLLEFDKWRPGEFISRFSSDLAMMTDAVSISLPQMVQVTVTFVGSLSALFYIDWLLAIVLLSCEPFI